MRVYIFDMDGTFINSMDYWNNLMFNFLETKGLVAYDGLQREILSMTLLDAIFYVKERFNLDMSIKEIEGELKALMAYNYKKVFSIDKEAKNIFDLIKDRGDKVVLATATQRALVDLVLERFHIKDYFDLEVVSDEVNFHKDNPQYFLDICNYFKVKGEDCVLVEDALYSMETGKGLGMKIVGITSQAEPNHLENIKEIADIWGEDLGQVKEFFKD